MLSPSLLNRRSPDAEQRVPCQTMMRCASISSLASIGLPALIVPATGSIKPSDGISPGISMPLDFNGFNFIKPLRSRDLRCPRAAAHRNLKCSPISSDRRWIAVVFSVFPEEFEDAFLSVRKVLHGSPSKGMGRAGSGRVYSLCPYPVSYLKVGEFIYTNVYQNIFVCQEKFY